MSSIEARRYHPACVEDWDEEAQASIPGTRTTANVAVKRDLTSDPEFSSAIVRYKYDGTDSGYASKAPTVSSMASSHRRRNSNLIIDTAMVPDRERKPYAMTARDNERSTSTRQTKDKESKEEPKPVKKPFCHKEGDCWVCDKFGFHFNPNDPPKEVLEKKASKPAAKAPQPSTQLTKTAAPKVKHEEQPRPPSRRMSSNTNQARPTSMYVANPVQAPYPQYPAMHHGWNTVAQPAPPPPHPGIAYTSYPYMVPSTPINYMPPQQYFYEHAPVFDEYPPPPPKIMRRLSMASQERPVLEKRPSRTNTMIERPASREQRPQIVSHKSIRSIDADRKAMPPPPKPQHAMTVNGARPRPGRANTYHANGSSHRRVKYEDSEDDEEEEEEEDDVYLDPRALVTYKEPVSPRRPPSSYKPPALQEVPERPQLTQKARSYQDGSNTVHVATTQRAESMPRRRATESIQPSQAEQREADAEAYMRKRGSLPLVDLTAENLKSLKSTAVPRHVSDQRSESGSTASHVTHHSSSKDSSNGRGRVGGSALGHSKGASMNINVNGLKFNITDDGNTRGEGPPVRLDLGGIQIHMNNRDKENIDYRPVPGQKQLERTPSMSSRPSRRSLTMGSGSLVSAATSGQRREKDEILAIEAATAQRGLARRESYVDEDERELLRQLSARSSRQASRNTSSSRQPVEELPVRPKAQSHRSSVDYSLRRDESVM